jgi:acetoin utilization deacetylase AcuC-like enzyme
MKRLTPLLTSSEGPVDVEGLIQIRTPSPITREQLLLAHDAEYVDRFLAGSLSEKEIKRIGLTPWTDDMIQRTLFLMGGALEATEHAVQFGGISANMAGGTHHAHRSFGSGYCVFNDLAVCALHALHNLDVSKVAVLDLDVHQGDGTATALQDMQEALTVSVHCDVNFPFRKSSSDHDLPIPSDSGDMLYLEAVEEALDLCFDHQPDLLLFQAGVDALETDALGKLNVSRLGMKRRNDMVFERARNLNVPVVVFMGGGYAKPLVHTIDAFEDLFTQAARWSVGQVTTSDRTQ